MTLNTQRLRHLRGKRPQKDIAASCGVSPLAYQTWEKGKHQPKPATLARLASALDVSVAYLTTDGQPPVPPKPKRPPCRRGRYRCEWARYVGDARRHENLYTCPWIYRCPKMEYEPTKAN